MNLGCLQTSFAKRILETVRRNLGVELPAAGFSIDNADDSVLRSLKPFEFSETGSDIFGKAYQKLFNAGTRKKLGEFYTPDWLADFLTSQILDDSDSDSLILDPACGSGIFLLSVIRHLKRRQIDTKTILHRIRGYDIHPLAALMARANLVLALELGQAEAERLPILLRDSLLSPESATDRAVHIVGNPPWINWDKLSPNDRESTKPLWGHYGLFNLSGKESRYGGAKKELAQLMVYRIADCSMRTGSRLAMVLPQSIFQTAKSAEGFRRFILPDGTPLGILRVDDFSHCKPTPFSGVATKAVTLLLEKGTPTKYPVRYTEWHAPPNTEAAKNVCHEKSAAPITSANFASPWRIQGKTRSAQNHLTIACEQRIDLSKYRAFLGANSGGANGVYWVEVLDGDAQTVRVRNLAHCGKKTVPVVEAEVETDLLYPLICWGDVDRFTVKEPTRYILLPQNTAKRTGLAIDEMRQKFPLTLAYFKRFEEMLRSRAAYGKLQRSAPFYSMYNVGEQTLAPVKVVWRRMDNRLRAATVTTFEHRSLGVKPGVPQETCVLIPCVALDEAKTLTQYLNGDLVTEYLQSVTVPGSKGFGSPNILKLLQK